MSDGAVAGWGNGAVAFNSAVSVDAGYALAPVYAGGRWRSMAGDSHPSQARSEGNSTTSALDAMRPSDQTNLALLDDAALMARARIDPEAFGVLYERHVRSVFAFAFSRLHDTSLAEDITSQTFLQALRALPRYQERGVPVRSWLFRITANLITDRHRGHVEAQLRARPGDGDGGEVGDEIDLPDPSAESEMTSWERAEDFARLIADLTPEQRTVVRLRFADGLPIAAIAAQMSRSEGAIKMLLMRSLQNLRRRLAQEDDDDR